MATKITSNSSQSGKYHYALGRRKTATAQVRLYDGSGQFVINDKSAQDYFNNSQPLLAEINQPFEVTGQTKKYDVSVRVKGGGHHGQVGAIVLGIAKALILTDESLKDTLRRHELLGRDPRAKERKKFGLKGARKKRQFTKR